MSGADRKQLFALSILDLLVNKAVPFKLPEFKDEISSTITSCVHEYASTLTESNKMSHWDYKNFMNRVEYVIKLMTEDMLNSDTVFTIFLEVAEHNLSFSKCDVKVKIWNTLKTLAEKHIVDRQDVLPNSSLENFLKEVKAGF